MDCGTLSPHKHTERDTRSLTREFARNLRLLTILNLLPNLLAANKTGNFDPERRNSRESYFLINSQTASFYLLLFNRHSPALGLLLFYV